MGYFVKYEGTISYPDTDEPLDALKQLNYRHDLKYGGRYPETGDPFEDKWFSWMPPRYHEDVESVQDVLELLGFYIDATHVDDGTITHDVYYDSKIGDEKLFLETLVDTGGVVDITAVGEDGEHWRMATIDGKLVEQAGRVVYD